MLYIVIIIRISEVNGMVLAQSPPVTIQDFEAFIAREENRARNFELINGEIVEKMATQEHGAIIFNLSTAIGIYLQANRVARGGPEILYRMPDDYLNGRQPDLSFRTDIDAPIVRQGATIGMPDFVIEVKSPSDTVIQMRERAAYYLVNGTRLVWLIYPFKRLVEVYRLEHDVELLDMTDTLDANAVLPDFKLAVRDIFANL
jgi:Uma2 family endonuclease